MPLKHRTESAYLLLLGVVICLAGALIALLPPFPQGFQYWALLALLALLYPLSLHRTFRRHRADYEFRLLHWFPLFMLVVWIALSAFDEKSSFAHILFLGFFVLWSLPLSLLGIALLALFAFHVLRRRSIRLACLSLLIVCVAAGSIVTEAAGLHQKLSATLFPADSRLTQVIGDVFSAARLLVEGQARRSPVTTGRSETLKPPGTPSTSQSRATIALAPAILARRPRRLVRSGPEDIAVLAVGLLGLYAATLHHRMRKRSS